MLYLLHATKPVGNPTTHKAQHYIGFAEEDKIWQRLKQHAQDRSHVAIIRAFHRVGAELQLVRVWPGATRDDERRVKSHNHPLLLCPICQKGNPRRLRSLPTDIPLLIPLSSLLHLIVPRSATLGSLLSGTLSANTGRSHLTHGVGGVISSVLGTPSALAYPSTSSSIVTAKQASRVGTSSATTSVPSSSTGSSRS